MRTKKKKKKNQAFEIESKEELSPSLGFAMSRIAKPAIRHTLLTFARHIELRVMYVNIQRVPMSGIRR